jgi:hypothetical protein
MMAIVRGGYQQGKLQPLQTLTGLREGRVRIILIEEEEPKPPPRYLIFAKYQTGSLRRACVRGDGRVSTRTNHERSVF